MANGHFIVFQYFCEKKFTNKQIYVNIFYAYMNLTTYINLETHNEHYLSSFVFGCFVDFKYNENNK